jgi:hypothetical protein
MSQRWTHLLAALALSLGACANSKNQGEPPSIDQSQLVGSWESTDPEQLVQAFEFAPDKSLKMTLWQMKEPITGTYSWSDRSVLTVEYRLAEATKQTAKEGLAAFREHIRDLGKKSGGQYGGAIAKSADKYPQELMEKEDFRVGISERGDAVLVLIDPQGINYRFKKAK